MKALDKIGQAVRDLCDHVHRTGNRREVIDIEAEVTETELLTFGEDLDELLNVQYPDVIYKGIGYPADGKSVRVIGVQLV